jgi:hypothetical protein
MQLPPPLMEEQKKIARECEAALEKIANAKLQLNEAVKCLRTIFN